MGLGDKVREMIAKRAAEEIRDGMLVNLGIGIPSLVPNYLPKDHAVMFHAENGIVGIGKSPNPGRKMPIYVMLVGIRLRLEKELLIVIVRRIWYDSSWTC